MTIIYAVGRVLFIYVSTAGVTLMALGAMAKYPGLDVKIVPCGMYSPSGYPSV